MSDHLEHACGGRWEPLPRWSGRYCCSKCRAIGYRNGAAPKFTHNRHGEFVGTREYIKPYICSSKGCGGYAVKRAARGWACKNHKED